MYSVTIDPRLCYWQMVTQSYLRYHTRLLKAILEMEILYQSIVDLRLVVGKSHNLRGTTNHALPHQIVHGHIRNGNSVLIDLGCITGKYLHNLRGPDKPCSTTSDC